MGRSSTYSTWDAFVKAAGVIHNGKYSYPDQEYHGLSTKINIMCPAHGVFSQSARSHLKAGTISCPECRREENICKKTANFVDKSRTIFGDIFDYSDTVFVNSSTKVTMRCITHDCMFSQLPQNHLRGNNGCAQCNNQSAITRDEFISRSIGKYGDSTLDYSLVKSDDITNMHSKVQLRCIKHNYVFFTEINSHLRRTMGCPLCASGGVMTRDRFSYKLDENNITGFDYSLVDFSDINVRNKKEKILCDQPGHGYFYQTLDNHLRGRNGCMHCAPHGFSEQEKQIVNYIKSKEINVIENSRDILPSGKELDIYIPNKHIAIEYNDIYWHTESKGKDRYYHYNKWKECHDQGIKLYIIWSDDYINKKSIVLSHIDSILCVSDTPVIYARKCDVQQIDTHQAREFFNSYHIQGFVPSSYYMALLYEDHIIAAISVKKQHSDYVLTRFATAYHVPGAASRLVHHIEKQLDYDYLITFADLTFSHGNLYEKTGWTKHSVLPPDYYYVRDNMHKEHKFAYRKHRFDSDDSLLYDDKLTEKQLADLNGLDRLWDCGKIKYVKKHP